MWSIFFGNARRSWSTLLLVIACLAFVEIVYMAYLTCSYAINDRLSLGKLCLNATAVLSFVLFSSSLCYYATGTRGNWNVTLSHLDALAVAVGTLTTAGISGITPESETVRGIMLGQMAADFVVVTITVGLVLQRLATQKPPRQNDSDLAQS